MPLDHVIISNDSEGYETSWPIVNVPEDYKAWYIENIKTSDSAWYAPMNRSYAIKYAKEKGYRYLAQLDDNIEFIELGYVSGPKRYRVQKKDQMLDDFILMLTSVLKNTNAGMAGCSLAGVANPTNDFLSERYCYSLFVLDLERVPDTFHGDFEDDIEYRLKMVQMGVPAVQVAPLRYSKTAQQLNKDLTGCRKAYMDAGIKRGEKMSKLYGDIYSCKMRYRSNSINSDEKKDPYFKHFVKPIKVGVQVKDMNAIKSAMSQLFKKWAQPRPDKVIIKQKKVKKG